MITARSCGLTHILLWVSSVHFMGNNLPNSNAGYLELEILQINQTTDWHQIWVTVYEKTSMWFHLITPPIDVRGISYFPTLPTQSSYMHGLVTLWISGFQVHHHMSWSGSRMSFLEWILSYSLRGVKYLAQELQFKGVSARDLNPWRLPTGRILPSSTACMPYTASYQPPHTTCGRRTSRPPSISREGMSVSLTTVWCVCADCQHGENCRWNRNSCCLYVWLLRRL